MVELRLDGAQAVEDVRVVVLQIVDDQRARTVMHELGATVEIRGVVFVRLHHEERRRTQPCGLAEIARHTADHESGRQSGVGQDGRHHAGGGRLAVGAGHGEHPALSQHRAAEPLGARNVRQVLVQDVFDGRMATRQLRVADDHEVRWWTQLGRVEAFVGLDARRRQLIAHRRIDGAV